jgi:hypothetical protein
MRYSRITLIMTLVAAIGISSWAVFASNGSSASSASERLTATVAVRNCSTGHSEAYHNGKLLPTYVVIRGKSFFVLFGNFNRSFACEGHELPTGYSEGLVGTPNTSTSALAGTNLQLFEQLRDGGTEFIVMAAGTKISRIQAVDSTGLLQTSRVFKGVCVVVAPSSSKGIELVGFDVAGHVSDSFSLHL